MKAIIILSVLIILSSVPEAASGELDLKSAALEQFEEGNYRKAIQYLKEAEQSSPDNPEIYYYLGYFTHYLCYDSVPLSGFNLDKSEEVLGYLSKAVELKPDYGNAYYFIGAECGARARIKLMQGDIQGARKEFIRGRSLGGYPDWLIEYGRNTLKSCSENAILFLGGDADTNPVEYLQLVKDYRTDITCIPVALLGRPWFVRMIRDGIKGVLPAAPVSWSDYQIMNMHNYKWKSNTVEVEICEEAREEYGIENGLFGWNLDPDISERLLSAGAAAIADIITTNHFRRDIHFSLAMGKVAGLSDNMQLCGLTMKLVPVPASGTRLEVDTESVRKVLLNRENYRMLPGSATEGMPRISGILLNYPAALLQLCGYHLRRGEKESAAEIFDLLDEVEMEKYMDMGRLKPHLEMYRKMASE
ncbi:MAG: tetratricopeptide repeat protein [Candidatus Krumholzibacteriales bacterium]